MSAGYSVAVFFITLLSGQLSVPAGECRVKEAEVYDLPSHLYNAEFSNAWSVKCPSIWRHDLVFRQWLSLLSLIRKIFP
jgi:hypothetical protein